MKGFQNIRLLLFLGFNFILANVLNAQCGGGPCEVCQVTATITSIDGGSINVGTASISGETQPGQEGVASTNLEVTAERCGEIEITVELEFVWDQGQQINWIHGVSYINTAGWSAAEGTIIPPDPGWIFQNSITGVCSNNSYGAGYYWDPPGTACSDDGNISSYNGTDCPSAATYCEDTHSYLVDGDPSDNWGIDCTDDCPHFGFDLTYCPPINGTNQEEISFYLTEDGETGGWYDSDGCIFQLTFPITINSGGINLPDEIGPICEGECVTLDAGMGCGTYSWSTGETSQSIEVCPTVGTTNYSVSATSGTNCNLMADVDIIVEFCCEAEAGDLTASPIPACPGEQIDYSVSNYNNDPDYTQQLLITDENGIVIQIETGDSGSFTSDTCGIYTVYSYNYYTAGGSVVPTIGMDISTIDCSIECCDLEQLQIPVQDTEAPVFDNLPSDMSFDCFDEIPPIQDLGYTDNCMGPGTVSGDENGSADLCNGGTITRTWEVEDSCGNVTSHTQTFTISPAPEPTFISPPADMTVSCENVDLNADDLFYSNGASGACDISGSVSPTQSGTYDECGGTIIFEWTFTDACNRTITHTQNITVDPADEAQFINPPADLTVSCENIPTSAPDLSYDNNLTGTCEISGTVSPTQSGTADECGGAIVFEWTFTDACNRTITHTQTVTVDPASEAMFVNPPTDITVSCDNAPTSASDLSYTNNETGTCEISGTVSPTQTGSYDECGGVISFEWTFTDACNRTITHVQNITVDPAMEAEFINPPSDITVSCDNVPASGPDLEYANNVTGTCEISGMVSPTMSGSGDECGGQIQFMWEFTDNCNRTITHTQTVTIDPPAPVTFTNPPADITVSCDAVPTSVPDLAYTNNEMGDCLFEGTVSGTQSGTGDFCGGTLVNNWEYTDPCGVTITHTQTITIDPPAPVAFTNPPADITVSCDAVPTTVPDLDYTNNEAGDCLFEGTVAGTQSGSADFCGGTLTNNWEYTDPCGVTITHTQTITVDPPDPVAFINPPADITVSCDAVPTTVPDLNYTNNEAGDCLFEGSVSGTQSGTGDFCGGTLINNWEYTDPCGVTITHTQTITIDPPAPVVFTNPPADITVSCDAVPTTVPDLDYTNNEAGDCLFEGSVSGIQTGTGDFCGGTLVNNWEYTDPCGVTITHTQTITIDPPAPVTFTNPPADVTVSCDAVPTSVPDLAYTNNESGDCLFEGTVAGTQSGSADFCGGTLTNNWEYTDPCGVTITHTQTITVDPPDPVAFINPPADITVSCDAVPTTVPDLDYTNNESGDCLFEGSVSGTQSGTGDFCGGTLVNNWEYTDPCGVTITHTQTITIDPPAPVTFTNPPADVTVSCDAVPTTVPDLAYTNNESGDCLFEGTVAGTQSGSADFCGGTLTNNWEYTDPCGVTITHTQTITVDPPDPVAFTNPPADITVSCDAVPTTVPDLSYTNNESGDCLFEGTVAGTQSGSADFCGGTLTNNWEYTDPCGVTITHTQTITVDPPDPVAFINPPADVTVSCDAVPTTVPDLDYTNNEAGDCLFEGSVSGTQSGTGDICGGTLVNNWEYTDPCGVTITHTQTITIDPPAPVTFTNPPADITVSCDAVPTSVPDLAYTNNESGDCLFEGTVSGTQSGSADFCGGTLTNNWEYTDPCGVTITHTQTITVDPPDPVAFINPPADITVSCDAVPTTVPDLDYTNNEAGDCLFEGSVSGTQSGTGDFCGGTLTNNWEFTDPCGITITHTQTITIDPPAPVAFINPPADVTVSCDAVPTSVPDLDYTNNEAGACLFEGIVSGTQSGSADICGGTLVNSWEYTDPCGVTITHTQTITVDPPAPVTFTNPPADITVSCDAIPTSVPDLDYTNNEAGACLFEGSVSGTQSGSADICGGTLVNSWEYTDPCGVTITHTQTITVDPPAPVSFTNPPADITVSCDAVPTSVPDLDYTNNEAGACLFEGSVSGTQSGTGDFCGGSLVNSWEYTDPCGVTITHTQTITIEPPAPVTFTNPPADVTVSCDAIPTTVPDLDYTNNEAGDCLFEGSVSGTQTGMADICGGTLVNSWEYTDPCGVTITHTQTITVDPPEPVMFVDPPTDVTISCDAIPTSVPDLAYTNNEAGDCLFEGTVSGSQSGTGDICGGTLINNWEYTDPCGVTITHTQTITIDPPAPVTFTNPPADITISCDAIPTSVPDLDYTNGEAGDCLFEGSVSGTQTGMADICGGTLINSWEYTDPCGVTITHTQTITVDPPEPVTFTNPPADITVSCENIPTSVPDLDYTNNEAGDCLFEGSVSGTQSGTGDLCGGELVNTWEYTDPCGVTITHTQTITIDPPELVQFIDPPSDVTVSCDAIPTSVQDLSYTNNVTGACLFEGSVPGTQTGTGDLCGGELVNTWEYTDPCGVTITHTQTITIDPPAPVQFVDPPADVTVSCEDVPGSAPQLVYTNNEAGDCLFEGSVTATESGSYDICGGALVYDWEYTDPCGVTISHTQIITIDPAPEPTFIDIPADITVECNNVPTSDNSSLNYTNNATGSCLIEGSVLPMQLGSYDICGGVLTNVWEYVDECNRFISAEQTITVNPAPIAQFIDPPTDITVECSQAEDFNLELDYSNSDSGDCEIIGTSIGELSGSYDECGGQLQIDWEFIDVCNRSITHVQIITVNPAPSADFIDAPADITVACGDVPSEPADLEYSNGEAGNCEIAGFVPGIQSGNYDACGGTITYTWTFVDECDVVLTHIQNITVDPADEPEFINPPEDQMLGCDAEFPDPEILEYDNNADGDCNISGTVEATVVINDLTAEYTWSFINPCNDEEITHTQILTISPSPDIVLDPASVVICTDTEFDLSSINVTDNNNTDPTISYHSDTPADDSNILNSPVVSVTENTTFYILAVNEFGCSDEAPFTINVEFGPNAGEDGFESLCNEDVSVNLNDFLGGNPDPGGQWFDFDDTGVNISNPNMVNFFEFEPGIYTFTYVVYSDNSCPNDTAEVQIDLQPVVKIDVDSVFCTDGNDFYQVNLNSNGYSITSSAGEVVDLGNNNIEIINIPIGESITITIIDIDSGCFDVVSISAPDCDCPNVEPPESNGDPSICLDEEIPELSVTVGENETANWYADEEGTELLIEGSLVYTPDESEPGVYSYYVEAVSTLDEDCVSALKTLVQLEIFDIPVANDTELENCDDDYDGFYVFDLSLADDDISDNPANEIVYYETLEDAENGQNPLGQNYQNTTPWNQEIFAVVTDGNGCQNISQVLLLVNPLPELELEVVDETCLGDSDGLVDLIASGGTGALQYSLDGVNYSDESTFINLGPGSYTAYVVDENGCEVSEDFEVEPGLEMILQTFDFVCNDNGTESDPSDDYYVVSWAVTNNQANEGSYIVEINGTNQDTINYGDFVQIEMPADESVVQIVFIDSLRMCQISQFIGPLNSCSTTCEITITELTYECSDNGTPSDPSDDTYTIFINAEAVNGASNGTFNVSVNGNVLYNFTYGVGGSFTLPADGSSPVIEVIDNEDTECTASQTIGPLASCSNECEIEIVDISWTCNDNGTESDPSDDYVIVEIEVSVMNGGPSGSFDVFIDGQYSESFDYSEIGVIQLVADGSTVEISIADTDLQDCIDLQDIGPLNSCSTNCEITITELSYTCNDNGTPSDPSDDYYDVFINAEAINGGSEGTFDVSVNGTDLYNFTYGVGGSFTLPADGTNPVIGVADSEDLQCNANQTIGPLEHCSNACDISIVDISWTCNDNGTGSDPSDDYVIVEIEVDVINEGTSGSFDVYADGEYMGTFLYSELGSIELPADGSSVEISVSDTDLQDCIDMQQIGPLTSCSTSCDITITELTFTCSDNGTPSDPTDDIYEVFINAEVINGGSDGTFNVSVDGTELYNFTYGVGGSFTVNADGSSPIIGVADNEDDQCTDNQSIGPLTPCSNACDINIVDISWTCNDNGTGSDPSDDYVIVEIEVEVVNEGQSGSFDVFADGEYMGTFLYSELGSIELPADGSSVEISVSDTDLPDCIDMQQIGPLNSCSTNCEITITELTFTCSDNGTPSDPTDDIYEVFINAEVVNGGNDGTFNVSVDGTELYNFTYGVGGSFTVNADGSSPVIGVIDNEDEQCTDNQSIGPLEPCSNECDISIVDISWTCNDNGTGSDSSDDYVIVEIEVDVVNEGQSGSFDVFADGEYLGTFTYSELASVQLPADGSSVEISVADTDLPDCNDIQQIGPLNSCSTDCDITITELTFTCSDNGTPSDPTDDIYEVYINAEAVNGSNDGTFNVSVDGTELYNFAYGVGGSFTVNADGSSPIIGVIDNEDDQCTDNQSIGPLEPCSNECDINIVDISWTCNDNGTDSDPSDDFVTVDIEVEVVNEGPSGSFDVFADGEYLGTFTYSELGSIELPADGSSVEISVSDTDLQDCIDAQEIGPLNSCSTNCEITITELTITCSDNGTPTDPTDDTYEVFINATAVNGSSDDIFNVSVDGTELYSFTYGVGGSFTLNADGTSPIIGVVDSEDIQCFANQTIGPLEPCSNDCDIDIVDISWTCNDNGTNSDPSDDYVVVEIEVDVINGGPSGTYDVFADGEYIGTFSYSQLGSIELPADGSNVEISVADTELQNCSDAQDIGPLNSCSTTCVVEFETLEFECNDAGTPTDPSDDFYTVSIVASSINGSASNEYILTVDGDNDMTYQYGEMVEITLPADGSSSIIEITDLDDPQCTISQEIGPLTSCSEECVITVAVSNIVCSDNGTPEDLDDDTYSFDIIVSCDNQCSMFEIAELGITGNYNETITLGPYDISSGNIDAIITDLENGTCSAVLQVEAPAPCSEPCMIELTGVSTGPCDDNNTGPDITDDTFDVTINVEGISGNFTQYNVSDGNQTWGPFEYGEDIVISGLPANGNTILLEILDVQNSACQLEVEVSQEPCSECVESVTAGSDQLLTCSETTIEIDAQATADGTYTWYGPNGFEMVGQNIEVDIPGTYVIEVVFENQCVALDSLVVNLDDDVPMVDAGPDLVLSCLTEQVILDGSSSSMSDNLVYVWTDESGNVVSNDVQFETDQAGSYYLQIIDTLNQCSSGIDEVIVADSTNVPSAVIYADPTNVLDCFVQSIVLSTDQEENVIYIWSPEGQESIVAYEIVVDYTGMIMLEALDTITGCQNFDQIEITDLEEYPIVDISDPEPLSCSNEEVVIDASGSTSNSNVIAIWYDMNSDSLDNDYSIVVDAPGYYYFELVDTAIGCTTLDSVLVTDIFEYPEIDAGANIFLPCNEQSSSLSGIILNGQSDFEISWTSDVGEIVSGANDLDPEVYGEGTYYLEVYDPDSGCRTLDSVMVISDPEIPEIAWMDIDSISCYNFTDGAIMFDSISGGTPPYAIYVNGELVDESGLVDELGAGTYNIEIVDANGCLMDTTVILDEGSQFEIQLDPFIEVEIGDVGIFEAIVNLDPEEIANIQWTPTDNLSCPTCLITEVVAISENEYVITVTDIRGCQASATIRLIIVGDANIYIPNVFSPNDDNVNDVFTVFADDAVERVNWLRIFDRWGEKVFDQSNFPPNELEFGWNGDFLGKPAVQDVFAYITEVTLITGETRILSGDVTLIR